MYTVGTIVEVAVTVFVGLTIFVEMMKKDFYYVNLISHAIACKDNWHFWKHNYAKYMICWNHLSCQTFFFLKLHDPNWIIVKIKVLHLFHQFWRLVLLALFTAWNWTPGSRGTFGSACWEVSLPSETFCIGFVPRCFVDIWSATTRTILCSA